MLVLQTNQHEPRVYHSSSLFATDLIGHAVQFVLVHQMRYDRDILLLSAPSHH